MEFWGTEARGREGGTGGRGDGGKIFRVFIGISVN